MAPVKRDWTDAEFVVLDEHYRPGERHRDRKLRRWVFTGRRDAWGRPLWYRRPILNRWQYGAALLCAFALLIAVLSAFEPHG
jgi:hypothetical protein